MSSRADPSSRWGRSRELFDAAIELERERRRPYLERACAGDSRLLDDVLALLDAHDRHGRLDRLSDVLGRGEPYRPPMQMGRYRVFEQIGEGGMGVVFRAYDERLDRSVALKFPSPLLGVDADWRDRLLAEAQVAASLEHPNICTIYEVGEAGRDGHLFIAMPLYAGATIEGLLRNAPLTLERAAGLALQACAGLAKAHEHGIVHRDIKPANLILTDDGVLKIVDFGLAALETRGAEPAPPPLGTAAYSSPEQMSGETIDHRTDIWSLGVVLYEMLTGARPFDATDGDSLRRAILESTPRPATGLRPGLPEATDEILARALAKDRAERFSTVRDLAWSMRRMTDGGRNRIVSPSRDEAGGENLVAAVRPGGEQRMATVLVTVVRSPGGRRAEAGGERIDEPWLEEVAPPIVEAHGGTVTRCSEMELIAVFGISSAAEDDPVRAAQAAGALHARSRRHLHDAVLSEQCGAIVSSGLEVGAVTVRAGASTTSSGCSGPGLHSATRLAREARPGTILASASARRAIAPFFRTEPAGHQHPTPGGPPVTVWTVSGETGFESRLEATSGAGLSPFVGRDRELDLLEARLQSARSGTGQLVAILGDAGAGKSRLLVELERLVDSGGAQVVRGRCRSQAGTIPYLPFREALRDLLGIDGTLDRQVQTERARTALGRFLDDPDPLLTLSLHVLGLVPEGSAPAHTAARGHAGPSVVDAVCAIFALRARAGPLVVLLEDWHGVDDASQRVFSRLSELVPAHPMLVVVTHRPDLEAPWQPAAPHTLIRLGPLDLRAAGEIARAVLDAKVVAPDTVAQLHARADGNPFFLEELCRSLIDAGAVEVDDGRAELVVPMSEVAVPETVQGVIRSRLDRVDDDARDAIKIASVIGHEFDAEVLASVLPDDRRFTRCVDRLTSMGFVHPISLLPYRTYRFSHALTREVAYGSLLQQQRRWLHGRVARAMETVQRGRPIDFMEDLAHHFGEAGDWEAAAGYARQAAERAVDLEELHHALTLLEDAQRWLGRLADGRAIDAGLSDVLSRQAQLCDELGLGARARRVRKDLSRYGGPDLSPPTTP